MRIASSWRIVAVLLVTIMVLTSCTSVAPAPAEPAASGGDGSDGCRNRSANRRGDRCSRGSTRQRQRRKPRQVGPSSCASPGMTTATKAPFCANLLDRFEAENPDIKVVIDTVPYAQGILESLPLQLEAGEGPDMARVTQLGRPVQALP